MRIRNCAKGIAVAVQNGFVSYEENMLVDVKKESELFKNQTLLEKLKSVIGWEKIPVVFLTSHSEKQVVMAGFELGVLDYIVKPFDVAALPERLKKHLK